MKKIAFSVLLISSLINAQQKKDSLYTRTIEDIKLHKTGNPNKAKLFGAKHHLEALENPQTVAVVTHETIEQQQAQQLSDVVKNVNGVYLTSSRGSVQDAFGARGYTFTTDNIFKNGNKINAGIFPEVSGLERVEVLKGSSAILFGNVAPGGILNMVTKKPLFNFGGNISLNYGSWNNVKPTIDIYTGITKNAAIRINGSYENKESFRDFVTSEKHYFNPSFLLNISDKTQLIVEADYLKHHFTPDFGVGSFVDEKTEIARINTELPINTFIGATWQYNETQMLTNTVTLNHQFNDSWSANFIANYQNYTRDYFSTERVRWFYNTKNASQPQNSFYQQLTKSYNEVNYGAFQLNINGELKTGTITHKVLLGADADYQKSNLYYDYTDNGKILNQYTTNSLAIYGQPETYNNVVKPNTALCEVTSTPSQKVGIFAQDLVDFGKLKVLVGARFNYIETKNADYKNFYKNETKTITINRLIESAFTPKLGLVYQFNDKLMAFSSYTKSFIPNNTGSNFSINGALKSSMIDQYEIGAKHNIFKNNVAVNFTAYQIDNDNVVMTARLNENGTENTNSNLKELAGKSRSRGAELDVTGNPTANLSLTGGVSYNHSVFRETDDNYGYVEGERIARTPSVTANASVFYTLPKYIKGLKFGVSAFHTGNRIAGWNNLKNEMNTRIDRTIKLDGFTTVDFSLGYDYKKFSILGKVANAFDVKDYNVHESYSVNPITPRNFYLTINYKL